MIRSLLTALRPENFRCDGGETAPATLPLTFAILTAAKSGVCKRAPPALMHFSFSLAKETGESARYPSGQQIKRNLHGIEV